MSETLNDFVSGTKKTLGLKQKRTLQPHTDCRYDNPEKKLDGKISACQSQVIGIIIDSKIRKAVDDAVMTVGNCLGDALLTAMDNVIIPRVEIVLRSITGCSSGHGPESAVQKLDGRDFIRNTENIPLISAFNHLDLHIQEDRNAQIRDIESFGENVFPALRLNHYRRTEAHHNYDFPNLRQFLLYLAKKKQFLTLNLIRLCSKSSLREMKVIQ